ncbi:MAG: glycosyltransferase family 4 protein [Crocinitomicaceae bacterium]
MKKILIIQNKILHYRKALYNELSKDYLITVIHSGEISVDETDNYHEIITKKRKVLFFYFQYQVLSEIKKDYDVIITMFDLHWFNNFLAFYLRPSQTKFIWWGQWLTKNKIANGLKIYFSNKNVKSIIYSEAEKNNLIERGVKPQNLIVANNTFDVGERYECFTEKNKNSILFVGSLDSRKELSVLIKAFHESLDRLPPSIILIIIGTGYEKQNLIDLVDSFKIQSRVIFKGKITSNKDLIEFYRKAFVSVSFGQAGLSVLQSLGYGVPFITKKNAISGGEITNIINNYNGFLCDDSIESLKEKILLIINTKKLASDMGENAFRYYTENCTIENMAQGFINAIELH